MENSYSDLHLGIQGWEITVGDVKILGGFDPRGKKARGAGIIPWVLQAASVGPASGVSLS